MKIGVHSDAYNRGFFDGYNSAVKNMEHQLDEANKAREQAEAALAKAINALEGVQDYALEYQDLNTDMKEIATMTKYVLQNLAKAKEGE